MTCDKIFAHSAIVDNSLLCDAASNLANNLFSSSVHVFKTKSNCYRHANRYLLIKFTKLLTDESTVMERKVDALFKTGEVIHLINIHQQYLNTWLRFRAHIS